MADQRKWIARRFRYADDQIHNPGRWEIFVPDPDGVPGHYVSVGGAFETCKNGAIAFLCLRGDQTFLKRPSDVEARYPRTFVWGVSLRQALSRLKWRHSQPLQSLAQETQLQKSLF